LLAQPFNQSTGKTSGEPVPVADNVAAVPGNGQIQFGVSQVPGSVLVYISVAISRSGVRAARLPEEIQDRAGNGAGISIKQRLHEAEQTAKGEKP